MSQHFQFEANMTLSGAAADFRVPATPTQQKNILAHLYAALTGTSVSGTLGAGMQAKLDKAVEALKAAGSKAVVVSGIQEVGAQQLVLAINNHIQSEVMNANTPRLIRQASATEVAKVVTAVKNGTIGGLITVGVNPALTLADGAAFAEGLKKLDLSVAFSLKEDETALASQYIAAVPHYLEAWGDYEFKAGGLHLLSQPFDHYSTPNNSKMYF